MFPIDLTRSLQLFHGPAQALGQGLIHHPKVEIPLERPLPQALDQEHTGVPRMSRLGLLERIRLTPEGIDHGAHRRLTRSLIAQGCRVFSLTYHSPSLEPGNTPYVRDRDELASFLKTLERYLDYFLNELGGEATTPSELYRRLAAARAGAESR